MRKIIPGQRGGDLMTASEAPADEYIYELKVTLKGIRPAIWRCFQVHSDVTLHKLHLILQVVMGWTNSHLYSFEIEGTHFGEPDPENDFYGLEMKNSKRTKLKKVASGKADKFIYEYDFGDSWEHVVTVKNILTAEPGMCYPVCLAGKRACPPEDCGGVWGYSDLLRIISNPGHKEYQETMEWLGGKFDPEAFDLQGVNGALKRIR